MFLTHITSSSPIPPYPGAGIGPNPFLARIATQKAKPNGVFRIRPSEAGLFLAGLPVSELPGVGDSVEGKLEALGIQRAGQLLQYPQTR